MEGIRADVREDMGEVGVTDEEDEATDEVVSRETERGGAGESGQEGPETRGLIDKGKGVAMEGGNKGRTGEVVHLTEVEELSEEDKECKKGGDERSGAANDNVASHIHFVVFSGNLFSFEIENMFSEEEVEYIGTFKGLGPRS